MLSDKETCFIYSSEAFLCIKNMYIFMQQSFFNVLVTDFLRFFFFNRIHPARNVNTNEFVFVQDLLCVDGVHIRRVRCAFDYNAAPCWERSTY